MATTYTVRAPASRVEALRDLEHVVALALLAVDPAMHEAAIRQMRCDLHTLGVTSEELDKAGLR